MAQSVRRESNIELLRILAMLLVVAHHFLMNSGVRGAFDWESGSLKLVWLQMIGMWGKTAINAFVLITGYFMCKSQLTVRRFLKLLLEMFFYEIVIFLILLCCGYETVSARRIYGLLFWPFSSVNLGFGTSFLWMYLFIPFMNRIIAVFDRKELYGFVGLLLLMFSVCDTIFLSGKVFHYVFWYMTVYFIGAILRLYPQHWMEDNRKCLLLMFGSILLAVSGTLAFDFLSWAGFITRSGSGQFYLVNDSNRILAVVIGASVFLVFHNLKLGYSRLINAVASTTFGVLLIHAASDGMRRWLWHDFFDVVGHFTHMSTVAFAVWSILVIVGIFAVCSALDYVRILFVERPLFKWLFK